MGDQKIEEMQITNDENSKLMAQLKEKLIANKSDDDIKTNDEQEEGVSDDNMTPNGMNEDNKKQMLEVIKTAKIYQKQNLKNSAEIAKLRDKLKAYKRRDEVNKQLRDNWNKQLNQMEQAVLLANDIYNRERTRHETEMAEKDV